MPPGFRLPTLAGGERDRAVNRASAYEIERRLEALEATIYEAKIIVRAVLAEARRVADEAEEGSQPRTA